MMGTHVTSGSRASSAPLMASVFVVFLVTGAALPVIPLHIHDDLGFGAFEVGLASGAQFAAALISRVWAGSFSDTRGPKHTLLLGLALGALAGVFYLMSIAALGSPKLSLAVLIVGRALLGGSEAFIMIGAQSWALAMAGPLRAGKVIGGIGTAMFVALATGAPVGSVLYDHYGFVGVTIATLAAPLASLALVLPMNRIGTQPQSKGTMAAVFRGVWLPGMGMAFASLGYGAMTTFAVLLFAERGWQPFWLSFTIFAAALILTRLLLGSLPDRLGGGTAAMLFVSVQAGGMALIWLAPTAVLGFAGATLAGVGYALVYPGLALEAMRRAPIESRGSAMGIYTAFIDVALGILTPLLGLLASVSGLGSVFMASAVLALCAIPVALLTKR